MQMTLGEVNCELVQHDEVEIVRKCAVLWGMSLLLQVQFEDRAERCLPHMYEVLYNDEAF